MADLYGGNGAVTSQKIVDPAVLRHVRIGVDAGAVIRLAAALFDRCLFAEDDSCAAHGEFSEVHQVVIGRPAVF